VITRLARAASRAVALTRTQRLARALFWICVGFAATRIGGAIGEVVMAPPPSLAPLEPVVEVDSERLYIVRFPFEYRGAQVSCYAVVQVEARTWLAKC